MIDTAKLDTHVEKVLTTRTVSRAQLLMGSKSGLWLVGMVSFIESALPLPIITDPFMVAGILANRSKTSLIVLVTLLSSIAGGVVAFIMARYFFHWLELVMTSGVLEQFQTLIQMNSSNTLVVTLVGSVTPIPYTLTAWVVAVGEGGLMWFIIASFFGRGFRYTIVGLCTYWFGPRALVYARRSLGLTSILIVVLAGLYIWLKL